MSHRDLSNAAKVKILTGIVSRQVELMAKQVLMLGGEKLPELVLRYGDQGIHGEGFNEELWTIMSSLNDSLNRGAVPIGYLYESAEGLVREPFSPGDKSQIKQLSHYEKLARERELSRANQSAALPVE